MNTARIPYFFPVGLSLMPPFSMRCVDYVQRTTQDTFRSGPCLLSRHQSTVPLSDFCPLSQPFISSAANGDQQSLGPLTPSSPLSTHTHCLPPPSFPLHLLRPIVVAHIQNDDGEAAFANYGCALRGEETVCTQRGLREGSE